MFENILQYQRLNNKLLAIKRDFESNKEKENMTKFATLAKDNQNKLVEIDIESKKAIDNFNKCKATYEKLLKEIEEVKDNQNQLTFEQKSKFIERAEQISTQLANMERNLSTQVELTNNLLKQFEICKNNIVKYKALYNDSKQKCGEIEQKFEPQINEIKQEMLDLEKKIDANLLTKYKQLRQDKIFPVIVQLNANSCGGCSMEFSSAHINDLKSKGYLECEHCRRINYIEN